MARIAANAGEKVYTIRKFLGLNQAIDGDAKLKLGEASEMVNWQVTREGSLKRRPGNETLYGLRTTYSLSLGAEQEVYRGDETDTLTLYESMGCINAILTPSGSSASTDAAGAAAKTGWYWQESSQRTWKITRADIEGDEAVWYGHRVTASPTTPGPVRCLWAGNVGGELTLLAACANRLYRLSASGELSAEPESLGAISTTSFTHIFGFNGIAYILDGTEYRQYDGTALSTVEGYRPLIAITITPDGQYETAEQINKLTATRRGWLSPDGENALFQLPEAGLASIDYVKDLQTGAELAPADYTGNAEDGTVTFTVLPEQGVNRYEVGWTASRDFRSDVTKMRFSELYSGSQDNRVFLYGDGSAEAIFSGLDYDGQPRGDYFPDLDEVRVGDENTPITAMIRHYGNLICFKEDSAWSLQFGITTLSDDSMIPAFYVTPLNRSIGNVAPGQAQLVNNNPITLHGREAYEWCNGSIYSSNLSVDERQAQRISDRVRDTLASFRLERCVCYDDNYHQNYYIAYGDKALVYHYDCNAWSLYDGIDASCMVAFQGDVILGTSDGFIKRLSEDIPDADGDAIACYWESGSTDFGQDYKRKHSAQLWVGLKPTAGSSVTVTVQTDRKESFSEKVVSADKVRNPGTREPYLKRLKLKAKKFLYYKIILLSEDRNASPTVLAADIRVRFTGYAK